MAERIEKDKKRKKQHKDDSSRPSKRVALEAENQISLTLHDADKWAPVIASAPGLTFPSSITLKPFTRTRRNAPQRPGRSGDIATKEILLHSSEHAKLDYTAREEAAGGADSLLKHYVGVYDPATGKMEVMEARKVVVRGVVREHQATEEDEISAQGVRARREELGQTFGTKKAKKSIASFVENAVDQGRSPKMNGKAPKLTAQDQAILSTMKQAVGNTASASELATEAAKNRPRPLANEDAEDPLDVYTAENVVGSDIMKLIPVRSWVQGIKAKQDIKTTSRFAANRIAELGSHSEKLKLIRYMVLLLDFYRASTPSRSGRKLPQRDELKKMLKDMPEAVLEGVKRKFSEGGLMNKQRTDSLIMHLCALASMVDNCEVDIWDLKEDLGLELKPMSTYFLEIGARIKALGEEKRKKLRLEKAAASQHKIAKIVTPLEFPKLSVGRRAPVGRS